MNVMALSNTFHISRCLELDQSYQRAPRIHLEMGSVSLSFLLGFVSSSLPLQLIA